MTPYDLLDRQQKIDETIVIIEGDELVLSDLAVATIIERYVPADTQKLNLSRIDATTPDVCASLENAMSALPFLADYRIVILDNTFGLLTAARKTITAAIKKMPTGNILIVNDVELEKKPGKKPTGFAITGAITINAVATPSVRLRYVADWATANNATLERSLLEIIAKTSTPLRVIETTLDKASIYDGPITLARYERESLDITDIKGYVFGAALMSGHANEALQMAMTYFANDPKASAIPLISGIANECVLLCECARPNGLLPANARWRERDLKPIAHRIGPRCARMCLDMSLEAFASIVSGRAADGRGIVENVSIACANLIKKASSR